MEREFRANGPDVKMDDEARANYITALRRIADALEAKKDEDVAFVLSAAHKQDNGQAVTAIWGPSMAVAALAKEAVKQTMPDEVRALIERMEAGVDPRQAIAEARAKAVNGGKEAVAMRGGLNAADADAAKLLN